MLPGADEPVTWGDAVFVLLVSVVGFVCFRFVGWWGMLPLGLAIFVLIPLLDHRLWKEL